jgi:porin
MSRGVLLPVLLLAPLSCHAEASPYEFSASYTGDLWRNAHGGRRTGGAWLDKIDLELAIDGNLAWRYPGLRAFAHVLRTNTARFSDPYVGDAMIVSNIDAAAALRLYEAWFEWSGGQERPGSVRVGLYDLNSEFDVNAARALFIHSGHGVGHDLGQTGENGPSIFPVTSFAVRGAWQPAQAWRVLGALLDAVPGRRNDPDRAGLHVSSSEGALGIVEVQWAHGRAGRLAAGHWRYTSEFSDLRSTPDDPRPARRGNRGTYVTAVLDLGSPGAGVEPVTSAFVRYGVANGNINEFRSYVGAGVQTRSPVPSRVQDRVGIALSWARLGAAARETATPLMERDPYEAALEITYRMPVTNWLAIQPDIQYVFNPGADASLPDSFVLGVRFELSL